jgi:hypothetical protein
MPGALAGCIGVDAVALTPAEAGAAWLARTPEAIRHVALMEELVGIKQMLAALCHRMGVAT